MSKEVLKIWLDTETVYPTLRDEEVKVGKDLATYIKEIVGAEDLETIPLKKDVVIYFGKESEANYEINVEISEDIEYKIIGNLVVASRGEKGLDAKQSQWLDENFRYSRMHNYLPKKKELVEDAELKEVGET